MVSFSAPQICRVGGCWIFEALLLLQSMQPFSPQIKRRGDAPQVFCVFYFYSCLTKNTISINKQLNQEHIKLNELIGPLSQQYMCSLQDIQKFKVQFENWARIPRC